MTRNWNLKIIWLKNNGGSIRKKRAMTRTETERPETEHFDMKRRSLIVIIWSINLIENGVWTLGNTTELEGTYS